MSEMTLANILCYQDNLERILDNLKEGIIAHDLNRRILFFNHEAEKITGYSRKEVLGRDCHDAMGGPFCGSRCSFCGEVQIFDKKKECQLNIIKKDGESRRIEMSTSMMKDNSGKFVGILVSFKDITDLFNLKKMAGKLTRFSNIIGQDSKMLLVYQQIRDVANYDYPVYILGETGTGKELVATAIHNEGLRANGPFVPINCGALPEGLIESELFGHERGAFSGAVRDRRGRFELADGGTIFLDEVAELSKQMQVKLLRFLQEGTFVKVGGEKTLSVNVQIISATNKNLKKEVQQNRFRDDLYYRLNVVPIHLPPLREKKTDLPLLVDHFLRQNLERYGRKALTVSSEALALMLDYSWPGNVRELQNVIQQAIVKCKGSTITAKDLPMEFRDDQNRRFGRGSSRKLDADRVADALSKTGGNKTRAAKLLGVGRATLYRFLGEFPNLQAEK